MKDETNQGCNQETVLVDFVHSSFGRPRTEIVKRYLQIEEFLTTIEFMSSQLFEREVRKPGVVPIAQNLKKQK